MESTHRKNAARATFAKKKLAVMKAVESRVAYDAEHWSGYGYATEHAVFSHLRQAMIDAGLVFGFSVDSIEYELTGRKTGKTKDVPEIAALIVVRCWLTDSETGFSEEGTVPGAAYDSDRKAAWQAIPGCVKYWIARQFMVATGDDPEATPAPVEQKTKAKKKSRSSEDGYRKKRQPAQSRTVSGLGKMKNELLKKVGGIAEAKALAEQRFGKPTLDGLDKAQIQKLIDNAGTEEAY